MVIKCPKCNHYVSDTTAICPHCGVALKENELGQVLESDCTHHEEELIQPVNPPKKKPVEEPVVAVPEKEESINVEQPVAAQKPTPVESPSVAYQQAEKKNTLHNVVIAVMVLLLCGAGLYILMNGNKNAAIVVDSDEIQEEIDYGLINGILNEIEEHGFSDPSFTGYCPDVNHPHMIDLGLPSGTKWACSNVGAENPCQEGTLWDYRKVEKCNDLPTEEQANELVSSCQFTITKNGIRVIGANGNCIYFPNNHVWIPSWYSGETGLQTVLCPTCWTRTGEKPWFEVYTPGEIINGTGGNEVKYAARFVSN